MKFKVVQCPRCKKARGSRLEAKTASCTRCGASINLTKAKILFEVESERELAQVVMRYNTEIEGGKNQYEQDIMLYQEDEGKDERAHGGIQVKSDIYNEVAKRLLDVRGRDRKIETAAILLCRQLNEFSEEDLNAVLKRAGVVKDEGCGHYITRLLENNVIYQPKNGLYRCL